MLNVLPFALQHDFKHTSHVTYMQDYRGPSTIVCDSSKPASISLHFLLRALVLWSISAQSRFQFFMLSESSSSTPRGMYCRPWTSSARSCRRRNESSDWQSSKSALLFSWLGKHGVGVRGTIQIFNMSLEFYNSPRGIFGACYEEVMDMLLCFSLQSL